MASRAGILVALFIVFLLVSILGVLLWLLFQGNLSLSTIIQSLGKVLLFPFQVIWKVFGGESSSPTSSDKTCPPVVSGSNQPVQVVEHEVSICPPCELTCPDPPKCPDTKPLEMEIGYLKNMLKFVGAICRRENAVNSQFRQVYPGFSIMTPEVKKVSLEYNIIKNQLREDEDQWTFFKNYFTRLTGIPSASSAIHSSGCETL